MKKYLQLNQDIMSEGVHRICYRSMSWKFVWSIVIVLVCAEDFASNSLVSGFVRGNDWKDLLLTVAEKNALDEFKEKVVHRIPESFRSDAYLIRWIRAKNLNVPAAIDMLFKNLQWREENNIDNILKEDWSDMRQDFPLTINHHDKSGRPVATLEMGDWDLRSAVLQGRLSRLLRYMDWFQEKLVHQIMAAQENGKNVTRAVVLVDVEGFNLFQHLCASCMSVFLQMTRGMEAHYPGYWEEIIVLNAPTVGRIGLDVVRPAMSRETRDILKLFDTNKRQWMAYLDERISRDQRSFDYGGNA